MRVGGGNIRNGIRNGTRSKTVLTDDAGEVTVDVPRDPPAPFDPVIVKERQRHLSKVDAVAISLCAKGLTTDEIFKWAQCGRTSAREPSDTYASDRDRNRVRQSSLGEDRRDMLTSLVRSA